MREFRPDIRRVDEVLEPVEYAIAQDAKRVDPLTIARVMGWTFPQNAPANLQQGLARRRLPSHG